jgi:hypothetical protein
MIESGGSPEEREVTAPAVPPPDICVHTNTGGQICGGRRFETIIPGEIWRCKRCGHKTWIEKGDL